MRKIRAFPRDGARYCVSIGARGEEDLIDMQGIHGSLWRQYRFVRTRGGSMWHRRPRRTAALGIALHHWLEYR